THTATTESYTLSLHDALPISDIKSDQMFQAALEQVDYFYVEVLAKNPEMKHIRKWSDFDTIEDGEIGAFLTLEGVDAIGNDLTRSEEHTSELQSRENLVCRLL